MSLAENIAAVRWLAAIMAAAVAGYSRLMGGDERGTLVPKTFLDDGATDWGSVEPPTARP
jgi:hypothetical protein